MKTFYLFFLASTIYSCQIEDEPALMKYTNLQNKEVKNNQPQGIDLDGDSAPDFYCKTAGIAGNNREITHFIIDPLQNHKVFVQETPEYYTPPVYNIGDIIKIDNQDKYRWELYNAVLVEKIFTLPNNQTTWQGNWKDEQHKYLPIQLNKNNILYNGWIELSVDKDSEKVILHKAAISLQGNLPIKAGK